MQNIIVYAILIIVAFVIARQLYNKFTHRDNPCSTCNKDNKLCDNCPLKKKHND